MVQRIPTTGITASPTGSIHFDGADAVNVYRILQLQSSMALYLATGMIPTRGFGSTRMRNAANEYSGSKARNLKQALKDFVLWSEVALDKPCTNPRVLEAAGLEPSEDRCSWDGCDRTDNHMH